MHSLDSLLVKIASINVCALGTVTGVALLTPCLRMANLPPAKTQIEVGTASWYGPGFDGKLAADGSVFRADQLTAAHRTLPLGTYARVTNLENGNMVHVRITDRGPFVKGRVLDLSMAAAESLGMTQTGLAKVSIVTTPTIRVN